MQVIPAFARHAFAESDPVVKFMFTLDFPAICAARFTATPGKHAGRAMPIRWLSGKFFWIYPLSASATASVVPLSRCLFREKS